MRHGRRLIAIAFMAGMLVGCAGPASSPSPVAVSMVDLPPSYRFDPPDIAVSTGTTVTWSNRDNFTHSVQFLDGGLPTEPLVMEPGLTATFTFSSAGVFRYQCHLHPQNMRGSVTVRS
jgi:plastocyanin